MHNIIEQKRLALQKQLNHFHQLVETNKNRWKEYLTNQMETKVNRIFMEQFQKYEINASECDTARHELNCIKELVYLSNNRPLISISDNVDNQTCFYVPHVYFPTILVNDFNWMSELPSMYTQDLMECFDQQQAYSRNISSMEVPFSK
jgi:hypothetical protein